MSTIPKRLQGYGLSPLAREHRNKTRFVFCDGGLSAGAGNTGLTSGASTIRRFIPAGAGNTRRVRQLHSPTAVYPAGAGNTLTPDQLIVPDPVYPLAREHLYRAQPRP
ncbi:hypothetical protein [Salmonella enterica]|uniref:hypothetical protein n=1 Tax=Salmonella enterica TaxID=28901 RepID=UPI0037C8FDAA